MNKPSGASLLIAGLLLAIGAGILYLVLLPEPPSAAEPETPAAAPPQPGREEIAAAPQYRRTGPIKDTRAGRKHYDIGVKVDKRVTHTGDGRHIFNESIEIARQLHDPETSGDEDVSYLNQVLEFYRMVFNENPVAADNQSVMAALMGENDRGIVVFPPDHPSLNAAGELVDRWQSPYYFHALSEKEMEIVSPGPDQKLGTTDDIIYTERGMDDFFRGVTEAADPRIDG